MAWDLAIKGAGALAGIGQGIWSTREQRRQFNQNYDLSRDQFHNQLQVRRADAEAAGIHPVAAMGVMEQAKMGAMIGQMKADIGLTNAETSNKRTMNKMIEAQIAYYNARTADIKDPIHDRHINAQIDDLAARTGVNKEYVNEVISRTNLNQAQRQYVAANTEAVATVVEELQQRMRESESRVEINQKDLLRMAVDLALAEHDARVITRRRSQASTDSTSGVAGTLMTLGHEAVADINEFFGAVRRGKAAVDDWIYENIPISRRSWWTDRFGRGRN